MSKNILIAAGGTGGHLFPAFAVAEELKAIDNNINIIFTGTKFRIESIKVPEKGYPFYPMPITPFPGKNLKAVFWITDFYKSYLQSKKLIKKNKIDALITTGAYLTLPPAFAADNLNVPIFIMESNVNLGKANKIILPKARNIFTSWFESEKYIPNHKKKIILTGNPVRKELNNKIDKNEAKQKLNFPLDKKLLLVIGGSLGAKSINNAIEKNLGELSKLYLSILWQAGGSFDNRLLKDLQLPEDIKKIDFIDDMNLAYSAADFIISRSGASAVSEIALLGKASILIPLPSASNNEQLLNASNLEKSNAAYLIPDLDLEKKLIDTVKEFLVSDTIIQNLEKNVLKFASPNAANEIAKKILSVI